MKQEFEAIPKSPFKKSKKFCGRWIEKITNLDDVKCSVCCCFFFFCKLLKIDFSCILWSVKGEVKLSVFGKLVLATKCVVYISWNWSLTGERGVYYKN